MTVKHLCTHSCLRQVPDRYRSEAVDITIDRISAGSYRAIVFFSAMIRVMVGGHGRYERIAMLDLSLLASFCHFLAVARGSKNHENGDLKI